MTGVVATTPAQAFLGAGRTKLGELTRPESSPAP
jgi:hypothetical protein